MNYSNDIHPPQWPLKLLRYFVRKEYLEEIEGDMEEIFRENIEQRSLKKARRIYVWEIIKLMRPILLKNLEVLAHLNQYSMFKNYFNVSIRGLMKNPLNSFINIFGLAAVIGIAIFGYGFARYTYSTDQFHEHKNNVYLVTFLADRDGTPQQYGRTPRPMGEMLRQDFANVKKVCRVEHRNVVMKNDDRVFHERVRFADPEFLEMFTFPLKWGTARPLADINSIVLSEEMSTKYFGDENPVGQSILMKFDKDRGKVFKISGVARDFPDASTLDFNFLVNFENLRNADPAYDFNDWKEMVHATFVQIDPAHTHTLQQGMEKYVQLQNKAVSEDWAISSFGLQPVATLHEVAGDIRENISRSSANNYKTVSYLIAIGLMLLALACFNYINIAIASAAKRLKEIGLRKSIGATRSMVIVQFLSENLVITFFALVMGLILGITFFIPAFEQMWDFDMEFTLRDPILWIYLPVILLFTSIASGIYPSLYISKFQVVGILKGSVKFGRKNPTTKVFLCLQLILSCLFITGAVLVAQNTAFMAKRSWGYNQGDALYAVVPDQTAYEQLHALAVQDHNVASISGSANHLGKSHATTVLHFPDREYEVDQLSVDAGYFETMGLQLKEGRTFNDHEGSDRQTVIVNELLVKNMQWEQPVGQVFLIDSIQFEVIGVVKEFHSYRFTRPVRPSIFRVAEKKDYKYLSVRAKEGSEIEVYKMLQDKWASLFPEIPFEGGLQEDVWGGYFNSNDIFVKVFWTFAVIAMMLAGLGLYGLMTLNVAGRIREFSLRKVLGADMKNIAVSITRQYLALFAVTLIIGAPISHFAMKAFLEAAFPYHMPITLSPVSISVGILVLILIVTVGTQVRKVWISDPVDGLKVE